MDRVAWGIALPRGQSMGLRSRKRQRLKICDLKIIVYDTTLRAKYTERAQKQFLNCMPRSNL